MTFGLGVAAMGMALGFAVILGTAAMAGTLIPLLLLPHAAWPGSRVALTAASLALMLAGVAVCSFAGKWKEAGAPRGAYSRGVGLCVVSGLLSSCGNLGFVFGSEIIDKAQAMGAPARLAPNAVWALLTLALFLCNAGYALMLLRQNRTSALFTKRGTAQYFAFGLLMGVMWMGGFVLYGPGARALGDLGPSLGWAILMSTMVIAANLLGLVTGEWTDAPSAARRKLAGRDPALAAGDHRIGLQQRTELSTVRPRAVSAECRSVTRPESSELRRPLENPWSPPYACGAGAELSEDG